MPKAIIITIDQLSARYLSPYGNTWNPTPELDNLAAIGMTAEYCLSSTTCLDSSMRSLLTGQHAISTEARPTLMRQLEEKGQTSLLIQEGDSLTNVSGCQIRAANYRPNRMSYRIDRIEYPLQLSRPVTSNRRAPTENC